MFNAVFSGGIQGMYAYPVRVEADLSKGLPGFELVGSAGREVKEARERVQIALKNAGCALPVAKITVNLSPAQVGKEGTGYDLPIAAGLLACMEVWNPTTLPNTAFLGELALNGEIRRVNGVLPIALALQKEGIERILVPVDNAGECENVPGIRLVGIPNMTDFIRYLREDEQGREKMSAHFRIGNEQVPGQENSIPDFADVFGQETVRRAAEVAAAGFHHLLLAGPPGAGKTMIARRIPGILPPLTRAEQLEVESIYSIAGKLRGSVKERPFLAPHHTLSPQALAGGGRIPRPGLLSLAHRGVLFLDEMPEFSAAALEVLRQPLEEKQVQIARSMGTYTYPADFMLVCAMNPCPCGFFPDKNRCTCTEPDIRRYLGKISGPVLDRIDIVAEASPVRVQDLYGNRGGESTEKIRERVMAARERQQFRYRGSGYRFNSEVSGREVEIYCRLEHREQEFLEHVFEKGQMSVRAYHKVRKLARTIADLADSEHICTEHLSEAVCYNKGKRRFWK